MGNSFAHADILSSQPGATFLRTRREVLFHPIPTSKIPIYREIGTKSKYSIPSYFSNLKSQISNLKSSGS